MERDRHYYVYLLTNEYNRVLYTGVTSNLARRIYEHKNKLADGFTKKYNVNKLVFFEETSDIEAAISREKQLKNWHGDWKINLITTANLANPEWKDLSQDFMDDDGRMTG